MYFGLKEIISELESIKVEPTALGIDSKLVDLEIEKIK